MPYNPKEYFPHVYGNFRKSQSAVAVRPLLPSPETGELPFPEILTSKEEKAVAYTPSLAEFGFSSEEIGRPTDKRTCLVFNGGESHGLKRLDDYIFKKKAVTHYNDTRNQLIGENYSSKLSPWLANGSLSPRMIHWRLQEFTQTVK